MKLNCLYFDSGACRSCSGLSSTPEQWRHDQYARLTALLGSKNWLAPIWSSSIFGSRDKAKFAVGGSVEAPILGRSLADGQVVELSQCQLHSQKLRQHIAAILEWITRYRLTPYDALNRHGELKYVLLQGGAGNTLMLRFVLRSREALDRLKKLVAQEIDQNIFVVVSANIQPEPKAILEGQEEIILSAQEFLPVKLGQVKLALTAQSFFQTNPEMAGQLYQSARAWLHGRSGRLLDLFCGVGGFAAHLIAPQREVIGVELSGQAVAAATHSIPGARFVAADAWQYIQNVEPFDIVVVNPPRRGLGPQICQRLRELAPATILYSSCNPLTLKRDLELLGYDVEKIQAFEMFPLSEHWEVLVLLTRPQE